MKLDLPPLGWHTFFSTWQLRPVWDLVALVLVVGYLLALQRGRRSSGTAVVHPARVASYVAGMVVLAVTLSSSIDVYAHALFWVHMIGHLLLIMVVPALVVCGHPLTVVREAVRRHGRSSTGETRSWFDRVLASRGVRVLTHPVVGLLQYGAVLVLTHLTDFMDQMMRHPWLSNGEHVLYLVSGYVFFLPLLGSEPIPTRLPRLMRIFLLVVGMVPDTIVGIVLLQAAHPLYPLMAAMAPSWGPGAVQDINIGGALMWAVGDGLMMFFAVGLVIALIADPDRDAAFGPWLENVRRQNLRDQVGDGGTLLTDDTDLDNDEEALRAYNEMLGRLGGPR
ncbi:MAG: cytochrome c oxidase assembly protein [Marmoricola sp.]